jgi:hypothetical protein
MNPDFLDLLRAFAAADVRFLVVGAYALALHGRPRATGDLDVWVEATPENARRVIRALGEFGAPLADFSEADLAAAGVVYQIGVPPGRIDILTELTGITFAEAFLRILIDVRGASTQTGRVDLIGTIGHELWHALEVLADRTLTTAEAIFQFYAREVPTTHASFETKAAVAIGSRVRHEAGGGVSLASYECAGPRGVASIDRWWVVPCV